MTTDRFFIDIEKKWLEKWEKEGTIDNYLHKNDKVDETFSFLDGPITANNPMGVHHAWGRTYKDIWQKYNNLLGYRQRFQNGFDCQGLWVEVEVEKELGLKSKKDIENLIPESKKKSIAKFVQLCKDRVKKYSDIQTEQSKRLGYFMDWENSYFTMSDNNNYMIWHFLKTCFDHGWVYKGFDSVPWCPRCGTAISQHEILTEDYAELTHETVYFKLKVDKEKVDDIFPDLAGKDIFLIAWTTTPWTVPGNVALAVNPEFDYMVVSLPENKVSQDAYFIVAKDRVKNVFKKENYAVIKEVKGQDLIGLSYSAPFDELPLAIRARKEAPKTFHTIIDGGEIVTAEEGTGVLHVAPGQGQEDFQLGKKEGLSLIDLIGEDAVYHEGLGKLSGQNAKEKPGIIFAYLKSYNNGLYFYKTESYRHRYPRCWRCKTELVWRVVDEWYIAMDKPSTKSDDSRTLRQRMMDVAKKITWIPKFGLDRELDWLKNMHDWMISKKRFWGLALPIWTTEDREEFEVIGSKEELKERAIEGWENFEKNSPHKPFIDEVVIKSKKTGKKMYRVPDVGNVWLDAGIVPFSTIFDENKKLAYLNNREYFKQWFPVDFITESFPGQFKNWFYSMIAMSTVLEDINPFKTVLGFATMVDEKGHAFHKSAGNAIEFVQAADTYGADIIRWISASNSPAQNILFGKKSVNDVKRRFYLTFWNVYRFYKDYSDFDTVDKKSLKNVKAILNSKNVLDLWIVNCFNDTLKYSKAQLSDYNSQLACSAIEEFVKDLSTWYLRRSRDRVWIHSEDENDKQSFYLTLYYILVNLSIIVSPMIPFLSEEIYTDLTGESSVHLSSWPEELIKEIDESLIKDMDSVRNIVEVGHRVRKELKLKVRQPLAKVYVKVPQKYAFVLSDYRDQYINLIKEELNVKDVQYSSAKIEDFKIEYDADLTDELILEGKLRDLIRSIQSERKKQGIMIDQKVDITIPEIFKDNLEVIKKSIYTEKITFGEQISVR